MDASDEKADPLAGRIREVEAQVLDRHHEGQALLRRSQVEAVPHLLKMYGNIVRDFLLPGLSRLPASAWQTELEAWTRALEQGLRWALKHCQPRNVFSGDSWSVIDEEARSLLSWARSYIKLCDDHTAASRGRYRASLDEANREIRFRFKSEPDLTMLTCHLASWPLHTNAVQKGIPEPELRRLFGRWQAQVDLNKLNRPGGLPAFECSHADADSERIRKWAREAILPELSDDEDLAGFSLGQLRDFWASLFIECQLITRLEHHVDEVIGPDNDLGSVMYHETERGLADRFADRYGVDSRAVWSIIDCLTFDPESPKSTLTNSPFVKTQCGTVSLLCRRVVTLDPTIMLASALGKRSRRRIYERLINKIERRSVTEIASALRESRFVVIAQETFANTVGDRICPDIMIYEAATARVLIVEYKHALPPIGAGEVDNRLRDLDEWTEQVRGYLRFAEDNRVLIMAKLGCEDVSRFDGMLLFRWPLPIPGVLQPDVTYGDWASLAVALRKVEGLAIRDILGFYRLPRDADQALRRWEVGEETLAVGQWTYRRPLIVARPIGTQRSNARSSSGSGGSGRPD